MSRSGWPGRPAESIGRPLGVFVLLVVAAYGARARSTLTGHSPGIGGPAAETIDTAALITAVGAAAGAAALLFFLFRGRRRGRDPDLMEHVEVMPFTRWSRALAVLAVLVTLAVPIALVVFGHLYRTTGAPAPTVPGQLTGPTSPDHTSGGPAGSGSPLTAVAILGGIAVVTITSALVWLRRTPPPPAAAANDRVADEESDRLVRAITAGSSALLRDQGDERQAIITCYAAMERSLAEAGAVRRASDTPIELLRRVGASGLITSPAAEQLTTLFQEARYSEHPVGPDCRMQASDALAQVGQDLRGRA